MIIKKTITRPANITAYAAGQVINANGATTPIAMDYPFATNNPFLLYNHIVSSNPLGTPAIDVYCFSDTFTIAADGAAFSSTALQMQNYLGKISHTTWAALPNSKSSDAKPDAAIALTPVSTSGFFYVVLVSVGIYTPVSGEVFTIKSDINF